MKTLRPKTSPLGEEDRRLWTLVTDTTTPLSTKAKNLTSQLNEFLAQTPKPAHFPLDSFGNHKAKTAQIQPPKQRLNTPAPRSSVFNPIEDKIAKKLAKGKQHIDGRIDLHGQTQDRARSSLLDFLSLAQAADHRIVLVITGKGNAGTGILKQRVPDWLSMSPFSALVNGYRISHISHGGEGALYVRIRRSKGRRR